MEKRSASLGAVKYSCHCSTRIGADRVNNDAAPEHVAAGDRNGHRHDRHDAVHGVRICLGPLPCVHSAHRHSQNCVKMFDAELFGNQTMLQVHHVCVAILWECCL